jgi:tetratricopeptide (TPR) repeat protein
MNSLGRGEAALADFDYVIGVDPQYPVYRFDRANLLQKMGRHAMALRELYYNRGDLRSALGDVAGAVEDFRFVLDMAPDYLQARVALAALLPAAQAVPLLQEGLLLAPEEPRLHCALGLSLMDEQPSLAREAFETALKLDPDLVEALVNRAVIGIAEGENAAAIADLNHALDLQPGNPQVLFNRGHAYEAVGRHSDAIADYRAALGYAGADQEALLDGLARCESALGIGEDSPK